MRRAAAGVAVALATLSVAPAASADRRCGDLDVDNGFPGVVDIRSERVTCTRARRVARAVQRGWQRHNGPQGLVEANGRIWRCVYRERRTPGEGTTQLAASCRGRTNRRKHVTMRLVS